MISLIMEAAIWVVLQIGGPFQPLLLRVPYYFGDLKKGP